MQKIRALARRGSGRVAPPPPPTRRASTCGGQDARGSNSSSQQLLLPPQSTSAAPEVEVGSAAKSGSTNALAYLGKKIFGSHHRRRHQHASAKTPEDHSAHEDRHAPKHRSTDLVGVFSSRRPRTAEESLISGGTSLMDMQAFTHVNRTTPTTLGRHEDAPDAFVEELTPRRRASEIVRELDSVLGFFLPDASEGVVTGSASALAGHGAEQGKQVKAKDRDAARHRSIQPSPPTPQPRRPLRSPSPAPRRHQKKRSQSSFTRPTSRRVDRKIVNHSDLDLCILLGDIARRNRGIDISPPRRRTHRRSGLAPPPPPRCPLAADVFVVEDTVKRNRRDALYALTAKDPQEKKDAPKLVRSRKVEEDLARVVVVEEGPAGDEVAEVATVRGWIESLPSLLQLFSPPEEADPFATAKCRSTRDAPVVVNSHEAPSEENLSGLPNSQTCFWGLFPLPPIRQEVSTKKSGTGFQSRPSPSELKKREKKIRLSPVNGTVPPGKPWKFKDLERLPSVEPADRFARIVRWVADVREAPALEAVPGAPRTAKAPEPYVPYWHFP